MKLIEKIIERRSFIRLREPIGIAYSVSGNGKICSVKAEDISADGLRFRTKDKELKEGEMLEMKLDIPNMTNPVHTKGKIIWKRKLSLEDNAPFDIGTEFMEIEEDNKNTFLKFLCDMIYNLPEGKQNGKSKRS